MPVPLTDLALFGAISLLSALAALFVAGVVPWPVQGRRDPVAPPDPDAVRRYEFIQGYLVSDIDPNDVFLPPDTDRSLAFGDLSRALAALHPELSALLADLVTRGHAFAVTGRFGRDAVAVAGQMEAGRLLVSIGPARTATGQEIVDAGVMQSLVAETGEMRQALDLAHAAIWAEDEAGQVVWANAAYLALAAQVTGARAHCMPWPLPALFAGRLEPLPGPDSPRRCNLSLPGGAAGIGQGGEGERVLSFELVARRAGDRLICAALPIDRLLAAETALQNFVQTLSKTFAHLPIGLAVFDRHRELVMFNPALVTLSDLSAGFLSRRPRLVAFLDALRDRKRMPEPKNYRDWRDAIAHLEARAEQGTYEDVWTLPGGLSLRVIGRPHPDGAVAFMFEDITAEVTLTRQFRGELELYRALIDEVPGAVAVFSGEGRLVQVNRAYRLLWPAAPEVESGGPSLADMVRHWQGECAPAPCWQALIGLVERRIARDQIRATLNRRDGRTLALTGNVLAGGAIAVGFAPTETAGATGSGPGETVGRGSGQDVAAERPIAQTARISEPLP
jgi:PAS domain-containing protein